ncbi:hypothetical protein [Geodermatophilus sp. SYSU D00815]
MSQDAASMPVWAGVEPARPAEDERTPQPPALVVRCDRVRGVVRARGHLDPVGAEVVAAQVDQLQLAGHRDIAVQLDECEAAARTLLAAQVERLAAAGVRVRLG